MSTGLIIAGGGGAALAVVTLGLRGRREAAQRRLIGARHGWDICQGSEAELRARLHTMALMQLGHSRRIGEAFSSPWQKGTGTSQQALFDRTKRARLGASPLLPRAFSAPGRDLLIHYVFETGFEERRRSHHWLMAVCQAEHACSRATVTRYDWLTIAAAGPASHNLTVAPSAQPGYGGASLMAVVEDAEEWKQRLGRLRAWLLAQPPMRSWEILPGRLIGYEPGGFDEQRLVALGSAGQDLRARLTAQAGTPVL